MTASSRLTNKPQVTSWTKERPRLETTPCGISSTASAWAARCTRCKSARQPAAEIAVCQATGHEMAVCPSQGRGPPVVGQVPAAVTGFGGEMVPTMARSGGGAKLNCGGGAAMRRGEKEAFTTPTQQQRKTAVPRTSSFPSRSSLSVKGPRRSYSLLLAAPRISSVENSCSTLPARAPIGSHAGSTTGS